MSVDGLCAFLLRMQLQDAAVELRRAKTDGVRFLALTEIEIRHKPIFQRLKVATRNKPSTPSSEAVGCTSPTRTNERRSTFTQDVEAIQFLDSVSKSVGSFLASYRQVHWIQEIANVTRKPSCTLYDVYDVLISAIAQTLRSVERVAVWRVTEKHQETSSHPSPWEVDVVASTAPPDDRMLPFVHAEERRIKRITLFKFVVTKPLEASSLPIKKLMSVRMLQPPDSALAGPSTTCSGNCRQIRMARALASAVSESMSTRRS